MLNLIVTLQNIERAEFKRYIAKYRTRCIKKDILIFNE